MTNTLGEIVAWAIKRHELQTDVSRAGADVDAADFNMHTSDDRLSHDTETPRYALDAAVAAVKEFDVLHGELLTVTQATEAHKRANDALRAVRSKVSKLETGYAEIEINTHDPATRLVEIVAEQQRRLKELRPLKLKAVQAELDARLALQRSVLYQAISKLDQTLVAMRVAGLDTRDMASTN